MEKKVEKYQSKKDLFNLKPFEIIPHKINLDRNFKIETSTWIFADYFHNPEKIVPTPLGDLHIFQVHPTEFIGNIRFLDYFKYVGTIFYPVFSEYRMIQKYRDFKWEKEHLEIVRELNSYIGYEYREVARREESRHYWNRIEARKLAMETASFYF